MSCGQQRRIIMDGESDTEHTQAAQAQADESCLESLLEAAVGRVAVDTGAVEVVAEEHHVADVVLAGVLAHLRAVEDLLLTRGRGGVAGTFGDGVARRAGRVVAPLQAWQPAPATVSGLVGSGTAAAGWLCAGAGKQAAGRASRWAAGVGWGGCVGSGGLATHCSWLPSRRWP